MIYLAVPYSHPDAEVRQARFEVVNSVAAELMRDGLHVFSPISHTHPIAMAGELPLGWDYWESYDRTMLAACSKVIVLMLDGWQESKGVSAEVAIAEQMGIPIEYRPRPPACRLPITAERQNLIGGDDKAKRNHPRCPTHNTGGARPATASGGL